MTLAFLRLPADERRLYIDEAAARRGLSPIIIEKDFWVCWLLGVLFESAFRDAIVFKGGTSLSKVFGVIDRFSEDIDLSLAPAFLGLDEPDDAAALSRGQANKWMERAEATCTAVVRDKLALEIATVVQARLGKGKPPFFTPSTIGRQARRRRIGSPATMRTRQHSSFIPTPLVPSRDLMCATASSVGRAACRINGR